MVSKTSSTIDRCDSRGRADIVRKHSGDLPPARGALPSEGRSGRQTSVSTNPRSACSESPSRRRHETPKSSLGSRNGLELPGPAAPFGFGPRTSLPEVGSVASQPREGGPSALARALAKTVSSAPRAGAADEVGAGASGPQVRRFMGLLRNLLRSHEVRVALDLLVFMESSTFGDQFACDLRSFLSEQRSRHGARGEPDPLGIIESAASDVSGSGLGREVGERGGASCPTKAGESSGSPQHFRRTSSHDAPRKGSFTFGAVSVTAPSEESLDRISFGNSILPGAPRDASPGMPRQVSPGALSLPDAGPSCGSEVYRFSSGRRLDHLDSDVTSARLSMASSPCRSGPPSRASSPHGSVVGRAFHKIGISLPQPHPGADIPGYEGHDSFDAIASNRRCTLDEDAMRAHLHSGLLDFDDLSEEHIAWLAMPTDRWVLHPNQFSCLVWQSFALCAILMESVVLPLDLSFHTRMPTAWYYLFTIFFVIDLALSFNTGYFHEGKLIMHRKYFTKKYLRSWFLLDLVSTLPWEMIFLQRSSDGDYSDSTLSNLITVVRGLRLLRLTKLLSKVRRLEAAYYCSLRKYQLRILMTKMLVVLGMVCHWSACLWGILGDPQMTSYAFPRSDARYDLATCTMGGPCETGVQGSPWRHRYGLNNFGQGTQYIVAMQYATALVVGGDMPITPGTTSERAFTTLMMIVGVFTCSIIVGEVLLVLTRQREQTLSFDEKMGNVHNFMSMRLVPLELQAKIRRYLEHTFDVQHSLAQDNREFLESLSPWLRVELLEFLHCNILTQHKFFRIIPQQAIRHLCMEAQPVLYAPGDLVTERGHIASSASFVVRGKLRVANALGPRSVYLTPPSWIGDRCLFVDTVRTHTISAVVHTETLCVTKACIQELCEAFPEMRALHAEYREALLRGDESCVRCVICNGLGHSDLNCPEAERTSGTEGPPVERGSKVVSWASPRVAISAFRAAGKPKRQAEGDMAKVGP